MLHGLDAGEFAYDEVKALFGHADDGRLDWCTVQRAGALGLCLREIAETPFFGAFGHALADDAQHVVVALAIDIGNVLRGGGGLAVYDGNVGGDARGGDGLRHGTLLIETYKAPMERFERSHRGGRGLKTWDKPGGLLSLAGVVSVAPPANIESGAGVKMPQ